MAKEKKATSKKTSKAKTVKVNNEQFDLIIDFGPAHKAEEAREKEIEREIAFQETLSQNAILVEAPEKTKTPWYKRLGKAIKNWFNR
jgi:hypothetical protein